MLTDIRMNTISFTDNVPLLNVSTAKQRIMGLSEESLPYARLLGKAMQYINFIRDVKEDLENSGGSRKIRGQNEVGKGKIMTGTKNRPAGPE